MRKNLLVASALMTLFGATAVQAETTIIHRDGPDAVVDHPPSESKSVTVREHGDGCVTKTVKKENDMGDSKTVQKESCD